MMSFSMKLTLDRCRCLQARVSSRRPQRSVASSSAARRELLLTLPTLLVGVSEQWEVAHQAAQAAADDDGSRSPVADYAAAKKGTSPASAIEKDYDRFAAQYDKLDGGKAAGALGFDDLRQTLLGKAQGQVLEIAVGTGLNLRRYSFGPGQVEALTGIDISNGMLGQAAARIASHPQLKGARIALQQADATNLPLPAASFDCVVDTFSLCVIPEPLDALKEMARVVKPGGKVLLLEHARSNNPILAVYQDVTASAVAATAKGCVWNQDVPALLAAAGLRSTSLQRFTAGTVVMIEAEVENRS